MSPKARRKIGKVYQPSPKHNPRLLEDVNSLESKNFTWKLDKNYLDVSHEEWGWGELTFREFAQIIVNRLNSYETMTWQDITHRTSCHPMLVQNICCKAQTRISQLFKDIDTLHQVDVTELGRVWGYRERTMFFVIWYDPKHTVCPINKD